MRMCLERIPFPAGVSIEEAQRRITVAPNHRTLALWRQACLGVLSLHMAQEAGLQALMWMPAA